MAKKRGFIDIANLTGVERIVALSMWQEESPNEGVVISEALLNMAAKLEAGEMLYPGEAKFMANALRRVVAGIEVYGAPFGLKQRRGRPSSIKPLERLALGKRVDELHNPQNHGLSESPLQLTDNAVGDGAYSRVAEEFGMDSKLVERAYARYLRRIRK